MILPHPIKRSVALLPRWTRLSADCRDQTGSGECDPGVVERTNCERADLLTAVHRGGGGGHGRGTTLVGAGDADDPRLSRPRQPRAAILRSDGSAVEGMADPAGPMAFANQPLTDALARTTPVASLLKTKGHIG